MAIRTTLASRRRWYCVFCKLNIIKRTLWASAHIPCPSCFRPAEVKTLPKNTKNFK